MIKRLQLLVVIVLSSATLFAGGFQINEHGARAMAMAGAFTGLADDASAVYFNPAGITQLKGTHISAGTTLILPMAKFNGISGDHSTNPFVPASAEYELESQVFTPFNFYLTQQLTDDLYIGLGVNNPYGLGTKWDDSWVGRYIALDTEVQTFCGNLVVAYKVSDQLSVSAGFAYSFGKVKIIRNTPLANPATGAPMPDAQTKLEGDGTAMGFSAGLLYKPTKNTSIGISVKSEMKYDFEGDAITTPATIAIPGLPIPYPLPTGAIKASLTTPMNVTVGFAYTDDKTTYTGDIQWIGWSSYDTLAVDFTEYHTTAIDPSTPLLRTAAAREYKNTYIFRAGFEHVMSDDFTLRGGLLYDLNPVPDRFVEPTLPDADRLGINIGCGYNLTDNLAVDVAYMFLYFMPREIDETDIMSGHLTVPGVVSYSVPFTGKYNAMSHLLGVNFSYKL